MNAIIFGAPGSGKGTYSSRLQEKLCLDVISMGDIFREIMKQDTPLGKEVKGFVEKGHLVPDETVVEVLRTRIAQLPKGRGFILDGFPRTVAQAEALEKIVKIDVVLQLIVPDKIIIERLSTRRICRNCGAVYNIRYLKPKVEGVCDRCGGSLYQRADDNAEVITRRFEVYEKQTSPLIRYYKEKKLPFIVHETREVQTPPDTVVEKLLTHLKKLKLV